MTRYLASYTAGAIAICAVLAVLRVDDPLRLAYLGAGVIIGGWVAGRDGWKLGRRSAARAVAAERLAAQRDAGRTARTSPTTPKETTP